jgi:hypothetical protein
MVMLYVVICSTSSTPVEVMPTKPTVLAISPRRTSLHGGLRSPVISPRPSILPIIPLPGSSCLPPCPTHQLTIIVILITYPNHPRSKLYPYRNSVRGQLAHFRIRSTHTEKRSSSSVPSESSSQILGVRRLYSRCDLQSKVVGPGPILSIRTPSSRIVGSSPAMALGLMTSVFMVRTVSFVPTRVR